ncbi:MAG: hypothetical protein U5K33_09905 [Halofilum sp. (in: g-proteobacteria)]|nr:hypothetical protein [Halofilum sp. (in: g-proteobacteria)]
MCAVAWVMLLVVTEPLRAGTAESAAEHLARSAAHFPVSAHEAASNTERATLYLAENSATDSASVETARTVRNATIAGVGLGMSMEEAVAALEATGFELHRNNDRCLGHADDEDNPCYRRTTGVTLERISGPSLFEGGFSEMTVRLKDDQVYWIRRVDSFLVRRLPDDFDLQGLAEKYRTNYFERFSGARYQGQGTGGRSHIHDFDDTTPPPWQGLITSPHAQVAVGEPGRGRYGTTIELHWKGLVGLEW